jgi:hypothetical protein
MIAWVREEASVFGLREGNETFKKRYEMNQGIQIKNENKLQMLEIY